MSGDLHVGRFSGSFDRKVEWVRGIMSEWNDRCSTQSDLFFQWLTLQGGRLSTDSPTFIWAKLRNPRLARSKKLLSGWPDNSHFPKFCIPCRRDVFVGVEVESASPVTFERLGLRNVLGSFLKKSEEQNVPEWWHFWRAENFAFRSRHYTAYFLLQNAAAALGKYFVVHWLSRSWCTVVVSF